MTAVLLSQLLARFAPGIVSGADTKPDGPFLSSNSAAYSATARRPDDKPVTASDAAEPPEGATPNRFARPKSAPRQRLTPAAAGYLVRRWGMEAGLPADEVLCVTQTSDGYIWASFMTGVVRFDGVRFTIFRPGGSERLPPGIVYGIFEDGRGRVLMVREFTNSLVAYDGQHFFSLGEAATFTLPTEMAAMSADGTLWKLHTKQGTISRLSNDRFVVETQFDPALVGQITAFGIDGEQPWLIGGFRLFRLTSEGPVLYPAQGGDPGRDWVQSGFMRRADGALLFLADQALYRIEGTNCHLQREMPEAKGLRSARVCLDPFGTLWGAGEAFTPELIAYFANGTVARSVIGRSGKISQLVADSEASVWVGCRDGLFQFVPVPLQTPDAMTSLPNHQTVALSPDSEGQIWMLNDWNLSRYTPSSGALANFPNVFRRGETMVDVEFSRDGTIWIAEWGSKVARLSPGGEEILETLPFPRTARVPIHRLFETRDGTLWITTTDGLWRRRRGQLTQEGLPDRLRTGVVFTGAEDAEGRFFIARKGEVWTLEHDEWRSESLPDGMQEFSPMGLAFGADGIGWWLGLLDPPAGGRAALA
ncbi:MAG: hypothetical protein L0Z50_07105, partial [Verrucomicrobiales bacterium]|nr:hypothetical protein [Verrucomicrobiales bacterium]